MKKLITFLSVILSFFNLKTLISFTPRKIFYILLLSFAGFGCTRSDFNEIWIKDTPQKILIDASHDGGGWWFPQSTISGFSPSSAHQGKALADLLRSKGFIVEELPSKTLVTTSLLQQYSKVIRAGSFGNYQESELSAYDRFLTGKSSLFLISDYQRPEQTDQLAEMLGIDFKGIHYGNVRQYAPHAITEGAIPFSYNAGSIVENENTNSKIQILGWLDSKSTLPVMGTLKHQSSKIFFLGDINGIEGVPQPLTNNIVKWLFE
jgi:hypothetical protein